MRYVPRDEETKELNWAYCLEQRNHDYGKDFVVLAQRRFFECEQFIAGALSCLARVHNKGLCPDKVTEAEETAEKQAHQGRESIHTFHTDIQKKRDFFKRLGGAEKEDQAKSAAKPRFPETTLLTTDDRGGNFSFFSTTEAKFMGLMEQAASLHRQR